MNDRAHSDLLSVPAGQARRNQPILSRLLEAARRAAIEQLPLPAYCCDFDDTIVCYNQAAADLWGGAPMRDTNGRLKPVHRVLTAAGAPLPPSMLPSAVALRDPPPADGVELSVLRTDGSVRRILCHPLVARGDNGQALGVFCVDIDVTGATELAPAVALAQRARLDFISALSHHTRQSSDGRALRAEQPRAASEDEPERLLTWRRVQTPLGQLLDQAMGLAGPGIALRGQTVYSACAQREALVLQGAELLARGLAGALEYASQSAPDGAGLALSASIDGDLLELHIHDSGSIDAVRRPPPSDSDDAVPTLADAREACDQLGGLLSLGGEHSAMPGRIRMILPVAMPARA